MCDNMKSEKPQLNIPVVSSSKIDRLKTIKEASAIDFHSGKRLFWLMKKILIEQDERINELEFKIAELRGEVEI